MRQKEGGDNVHLIYSKPVLKNLSQGSRISFIRQFRYLTQDDVSDMLGLEGESKRRTITRYERGSRNPSKNRLKELSKILLVDSSLIEKYEFKDKTDLIYFFLWLEELFPKLEISLNSYDEDLNDFFVEWNKIRLKRRNYEITYEKYIEWKLNYKYRKD